ncbi:hypothetical protein [Thermoflavimicrobium dichotomicum]|uniref:Uncharacterized protein n=1 Tax=Thermoflavimicrobium dichotomicum TaxID=46223 RepID=A0A1I3U9E6_9BACL|nr:hypothetical protein [Thermoflavimicrobium dichotomicum]SFJ78381.1 hypothetical protein SAMN05421852_12216 [Thermoflavimicrobium dichotomicum]
MSIGQYCELGCGCFRIFKEKILDLEIPQRSETVDKPGFPFPVETTSCSYLSNGSETEKENRHITETLSTS